MKRLTIFALVLSSPAAAAACQPDSPVDAREALLETLDRMDAAIRAGDREAFMSFYVESPLHLPPGSPRNASRESIFEFLEGTLDLYDLEGEPTIQFSADATMAYVFGQYTTRVDSERSPESIRGRSITIWRRSEGGPWQCVVDIWNSEDPRFAHL